MGGALRADDMGLDCHALRVARRLQVTAVGRDQSKMGGAGAAQALKLTTQDVVGRIENRLLDAFTLKANAALRRRARGFPEKRNSCGCHGNVGKGAGRWPRRGRTLNRTTERWLGRCFDQLRNILDHIGSDVFLGRE